MTIPVKPQSSSNKPGWGSSYRLVAAEKWKAKSAAMGKPVTDALVEYAAPQPGMQVLDVATGTGEPAITIAMRVGPQGHVTALDLSAELLDIAKGRAQERGLDNFVAQQGDVHQLPFPHDYFDLVTSRFGVMFFRDPALALREIRRVLRPQARACFLVWGSFDQPYWQSTMGIVRRHVGGPLLQPGGPDPFCFAEPRKLSQLLHDAGFREVHEETKNVAWTWPGAAEELWEYARSVSVPFRAMLDRVPKELWPKIDAEVHAAIGQYVRGETIEFGASVVLASGSK